MQQCSFKPKINREHKVKMYKQKAEDIRSQRREIEEVATHTTSLEVTLGEGIKGTMVIKKGEKPSEIAKRFTLKYNLDKSTEKLLKELLKDEMRKDQ